MQVKQRLRINTAVMVLSIGVLIVVLIVSARHVKRAVEQNQIADALATAAFERLALRTDYIRTGSERAREQILAKNLQIDRLLKAASGKYKGTDNKQTIAAMMENQESISKILGAIFENRELKGRGTSLSQEVEDRLLAQLNMRVYELVLLDNKLQESSTTAFISALGTSGWSIALVFLLMGAATIINSVSMNRTIAARIGRLRDGAAAIGEGNLGHQIDIKGDDEFAELADAFNEMTAKLCGSYLDLEREIEERRRAEKALLENAARLQESEHRLRTLSDQIPGGAIYQHAQQPDGRVSYAYMSAGIERLFGIPAVEILADPGSFLRLVVEEDRPRVIAATEQSARDLTPFDCEFRQRTVTGEVKWVQCRSMPRCMDDGSTVWDGVVMDITGRKQAEEAFRASEERFKLSMEATNDGLWDWNAETDEVYFSPSYYRILGYEPGSFPGNLRAWKDLVHPEDLERTVRANMDCVEGRTEYFAVEYRMKARTGEWRWILGRGKCVMRNEQGRAIRLIGTHVDVTARRQTEEALRESEERLSLALRSAEMGVWRLDLSEQKRYFDGQVCHCLGIDPVRFDGTAEEFFAVVHCDDRDRIKAAMDRTVGSGVPYEVEYRAVWPDGGIRHVAARGRLARDAAGQPQWVDGLLWDVTERKLAEEEREISVEFLSLVNESRNSAELIRAAITFFREKSGCEAVGIRLKEGNDYPYFEANGFPEEFILRENYLCDYDDNGRIIRDFNGNPKIECMCGNVICGRFDPSQPFFTAKGSFWSNCTTDLLATTTDADRQARTRNRCNGEGYESVALIPLHSGTENLGLLQLNDKRKGCFTPVTIALWERLAGYLAVALTKFKTEEALQQAHRELALQMEERVRELREKEVLLKEVHHRVKNNLQVISSLVGMQAEGMLDETVRQVLQDVTYRVRSMALVHEKLYQSESLALIDFAEYAKSLLHYLWRAHGAAAEAIGLTLELGPVSLPVDTAVPCGLILNELAGNALKHAFRGRNEGNVTVSLHRAEDGSVSLSIGDNGVGLPKGFDWSKSGSLGLRLVQMLAGQLRAEVAVSGNEGTEFMLTFRLKAEG